MIGLPSAGKSTLLGRLGSWHFDELVGPSGHQAVGSWQRTHTIQIVGPDFSPAKHMAVHLEVTSWAFSFFKDELRAFLESFDGCRFVYLHCPPGVVSQRLRARLAEKEGAQPSDLSVASPGSGGPPGSGNLARIEAMARKCGDARFHRIMHGQWTEFAASVRGVKVDSIDVHFCELRGKILPGPPGDSRDGV